MIGLDSFLTPDDWAALLSGLVLSLQITVLVLVAGLPLGMILATGAMSHRRAVSWTSIGIVEVGRGVPVLVLLYLVYYGLPSQGIILPAMAAAVLALGVSTGCYTSEIFRTALRSVPLGQREAAASIGLSRPSAFRTVVLPQALRVATPQLVSFSILIFQATALCFAIAMPVLLSQAYQIGTFTFEYLKVLSIAALMYAAISIPGSQVASWLENRVSRRL
jgi:polar amino acid transport system permease protein